MQRDVRDARFSAHKTIALAWPDGDGPTQDIDKGRVRRVVSALAVYEWHDGKWVAPIMMRGSVEMQRVSGSWTATRGMTIFVSDFPALREILRENAPTTLVDFSEFDVD